MSSLTDHHGAQEVLAVMESMNGARFVRGASDPRWSLPPDW